MDKEERNKQNVTINIQMIYLKQKEYNTTQINRNDDQVHAFEAQMKDNLKNITMSAVTHYLKGAENVEGVM